MRHGFPLLCHLFHSLLLVRFERNPSGLSILASVGKEKERITADQPADGTPTAKRCFPPFAVVAGLRSVLILRLCMCPSPQFLLSDTVLVRRSAHHSRWENGRRTLPPRSHDNAVGCLLESCCCCCCCHDMIGPFLPSCCWLCSRMDCSLAASIRSAVAPLQMVYKIWGVNSGL